jgi:6,7-dimethyl-8-ribityllumazine synthase
MAKVFEGRLDGKGKRFGIVASRFNEAISSRLLAGAIDCLRRHGVEDDDILVAHVPGAMEIPLVARRLARTGHVDAIICVGAVIRGATPHFDYVASVVSRGVAATSRELDLPVLFAVLTTDSVDQAMERAGTKSGNKGFEAALGALEMTNLLDALG